MGEKQDGQRPDESLGIAGMVVWGSTFLAIFWRLSLIFLYLFDSPSSPHIQYYQAVRFLIFGSFSSSLNGLPEFCLTEAVQSFTFRLEEELNTTDIYCYRKVFDNISSCMENFNLGKNFNFSSTCSGPIVCCIDTFKCLLWSWNSLSVLIFFPSQAEQVLMICLKMVSHIQLCSESWLLVWVIGTGVLRFPVSW